MRKNLLIASFVIFGGWLVGHASDSSPAPSNGIEYPGGWGWARWVGLEQKPFNDGMQSCVGCHTPVKSRDWVFTDPAPFPD